MELIVADELAARLDADERRLLRAGELATRPDYQCWQCGQPGDLRHDPTAVILFVDDAQAIATLGWVHARCGPSAVYPLSQMTLWAAAHADTGRGTDDEIYTTRVEIEDTLYPTLVVVPASNIAALRTGSATLVDSCVEQMRQEGFQPVALPVGWQRPVELPHWAVRVKGGNLLAITQPTGRTWWSWNGATPCHLDDAWVAAALRTRQVLLLVTGAQLAEHDDDEAIFRAGLASASSSNRLVGALVSINAPAPTPT